jgi:hypothetical protein
MSEPTDHEAAAFSELADVLFVFVALLTPLFLIVVLVGPSREVLLSLGVFGLFIVGSLLLTGVILREGAGTAEGS